MNQELNQWREKTKGLFNITEYKRFWNYISNLEEKNNKLGFENIMLKMEKDIYKQGYEELKELIEKAITEVKND